MKKLIVFSLFFYSYLLTTAQVIIKPVTIKKVETVKVTEKQAQDPAITYNNLYTNLLTPEKPKIEGLGEFTYWEKNADYNEETKKLIIHGCQMKRKGDNPDDDIRQPCYAFRVTINIFDTTTTKFRIDAEVVSDKSQYELIKAGTSGPELSNVIPDFNNYQFKAVDAYWDYKDNVVINEVILNRASGLQTLKLLLKQLPNGEPIPAWVIAAKSRVRALVIYLTADYDFELKSIKIIPLH